MTKREAEGLAEEVGRHLGWLVIRLVYLKILWWGLGLEAWCGLSLPWGVALFAAMLMKPSKFGATPRSIPFDRSLH
ncbi:MAG: hypothetical protein V3T08_10070 [Gemmatimonadota bacterium]